MKKWFITLWRKISKSSRTKVRNQYGAEWELLSYLKFSHKEVIPHGDLKIVFVDENGRLWKQTKIGNYWGNKLNEFMKKECEIEEDTNKRIQSLVELRNSLEDNPKPKSGQVNAKVIIDNNQVFVVKPPERQIVEIGAIDTAIPGEMNVVWNDPVVAQNFVEAAQDINKMYEELEKEQKENKMSDEYKCAYEIDGMIALDLIRKYRAICEIYIAHNKAYTDMAQENHRLYNCRENIAKAANFLKIDIKESGYDEDGIKVKKEKK